MKVLEDAKSRFEMKATQENFIFPSSRVHAICLDVIFFQQISSSSRKSNFFLFTSIQTSHNSRQDDSMGFLSMPSLVSLFLIRISPHLSNDTSEIFYLHISFDCISFLNNLQLGNRDSKIFQTPILSFDSIPNLFLQHWSDRFPFRTQSYIPQIQL